MRKESTDSFISVLVTFRPAHGSSRPPNARRAEERRNTQRTPRYVRHVDEFNAEGGGTD